MRVVFAGPSLFGADFDRTGLDFRPPARQGDIAKAVLQGATAIGLIDGVFGSAASVWHKEILHALSLGIRVLGAASMGALRAAECVSYGMEPVGEIAARYASGELDDDAAVALTFGPAELGYCPLSEPLVDVTDRVERMVLSDRIMSAEGDAIISSARRLYYADRTVPNIMGGATGIDPARRLTISSIYSSVRPSAKQRDALALVALIRDEAPLSPVADWEMAEPPFWKSTLKRLASEVDEKVTIQSR